MRRKRRRRRRSEGKDESKVDERIELETQFSCGGLDSSHGVVVEDGGGEGLRSMHHLENRFFWIKNAVLSRAEQLKYFRLKMAGNCQFKMENKNQNGRMMKHCYNKIARKKVTQIASVKTK